MTETKTARTKPTFAQKIEHFLLKITLSLLLLLAATCAIYLVVAYYFSYSDGQSVGVVQKLSKKGWICKTWEGEQIRLNARNIAVPEKFMFGTRDDAVAEKINASLGKEIILHYEQHLGLPSCFGDTEYFVTNMTIAP